MHTVQPGGELACRKFCLTAAEQGCCFTEKALHGGPDAKADGERYYNADPQQDEAEYERIPALARWLRRGQLVPKDGTAGSEGGPYRCLKAVQNSSGWWQGPAEGANVKFETFYFMHDEGAQDFTRLMACNWIRRSKL